MGNLNYINGPIIDVYDSCQQQIILTISVFVANYWSIAKCKQKICNLRIPGKWSDFIDLFDQVFEQSADSIIYSLAQGARSFDE